MSSSEYSDERNRSPSPYFEDRRRSKKSSFSPDRHKSHRRGSHDDYRKNKHHRSHSGASTSRAKTHDRGRREERDRHHRDDYKKEEKSFRAASPPLTFASDTFLERSTVLKPKKEGDVIESMENAFTDGPLEVLKRCVHDGQKVMIWVRGQKGIRGICTGFVLAFDKYWNLVMQDVDEVYQKNINPRTPFLLSEREGHHLPEKSEKKKKTGKSKMESGFTMTEEERQELREARKKRQEEERRQRNAERSEVSKRHLPRTFIRGDNVVFIKICE